MITYVCIAENVLTLCFMLGDKFANGCSPTACQGNIWLRGTSLYALRICLLLIAIDLFYILKYYTGI